MFHWDSQGRVRTLPWEAKGFDSLELPKELSRDHAIQVEFGNNSSFKVQILLSSYSVLRKLLAASGLAGASPTKRAFSSYQRGFCLLPTGRSSPTKWAARAY